MCGGVDKGTLSPEISQTCCKRTSSSTTLKNPKSFKLIDMLPKFIGSVLNGAVRPSWARTGGGHDQIMIELCSTIVCSISLDYRGPSIRSWSSRESIIWSFFSIIGTVRSCSTIIEYARASWIMTDHSTLVSYCAILWTYTKGATGTLDTNSFDQVLRR